MFFTLSRTLIHDKKNRALFCRCLTSQEPIANYIHFYHIKISDIGRVKTPKNRQRSSNYSPLFPERPTGSAAGSFGFSDTQRTSEDFQGRRRNRPGRNRDDSHHRAMPLSRPGE